MRGATSGVGVAFLRLLKGRWSELHVSGSTRSMKKEAQLREAGFDRLEFYYPLPDYKLPTEIYSQYHLPEVYPFGSNTPNYDRERYSFFDEGKAMNELIREGKFEMFANSYLVVCEGGAR